MKRLKLQVLRFDEHTITFNSGVNYIVGTNASGKTTIFNLIQYLLGLRKDIGFYGSFIKKDEVSLDVLIDNVPFTFKRNLRDKEIIVNNNDQQFGIVFGSPSFSSFLLNLFQPLYNYEVDQRALVAMLKDSFISEDNDLFSISAQQKETKLLSLGINSIYPKRIKTYLKELESQMFNQRNTLSGIDSYRKDIQFLLNRELKENKDIVDEILSASLRKYTEESSQLELVYKDSTEFLSKLLDENEHLLQSKINELSPNFSSYLKSIGIENRISINDLLEGNYKYVSNGEVSLVRLVFEILVQSHIASLNRTGLLVNDGRTSYFDHHMSSGFRKFLNQMVSGSDLQYIEFSSNPLLMEKNEIVFDTTKNLRYV